MDDRIGFLVVSGVSDILGMMVFDFFAFFEDSTFVLVLVDDGGTVIGLPLFAASS